MRYSIRINRTAISLGVVAAVLLFCIIFSQTKIFAANSAVYSTAVTFDLLLTAPLVCFLLIRKTNIPAITIVPVIVLGLITGTYILPPDEQNHLQLFKKWGLPVLELTVFLFIIMKVRKAVRQYKFNKGTSADFYSILKKTCNEILPKGLAILAATEIAVIYYGLITWRKITPEDNEFSYHKKSGIIAILGAIVFIVLIETMVIHFLVFQWNNALAWILTSISIYTITQLFGILKSLPRRYIIIGHTHLTVRYGIWREAEIKFENIKSITLSQKGTGKKNKLVKHISAFSHLEGHNVVLELHHESYLSGVYGLNKKFRILTFNVDDRERFKQTIDNYTGHSEERK